MNSTAIAWYCVIIAPSILQISAEAYRSLSLSYFHESEKLLVFSRTCIQFLAHHRQLPWGASVVVCNIDSWMLFFSAFVVLVLYVEYAFSQTMWKKCLANCHRFCLSVWCEVENKESNSFGAHVAYCKLVYCVQHIFDVLHYYFYILHPVSTDSPFLFCTCLIMIVVCELLARRLTRT